ncbi:hypothetical protein FACS189426_21800 [Bacteroidia bacterium]|nr:hypothetical protein FACS189426_21800 [Bacteroidia bacterium]
MLQFDVITGFNINVRYNTFKEDFYRKCTPEFSEEWIGNIKNIRSWIKERLKSIVCGRYAQLKELLKD